VDVLKKSDDRPFLGRAVSSIAGQRLPSASVFGEGVDRLARGLEATEDLDLAPGRYTHQTARGRR
jgi:hypothetical protein